MKEHYHSYQQSVLMDIPEGFTTFAKELLTANSNYPTLYSYLHKLTESLFNAVEDNNEELYFNNLRVHQKAMLKALSIFHRGSDVENMPLKVWKFKPVVVVFDKFTWIPRYRKEYEKYNMPLFSCWEMESVINLRLTPSSAQLLLKEKGDRIFTPQQQLLPIQDVNKPLVKDWTLNL